jgi:Asp/Glu/hydantoin racemase
VIVGCFADIAVEAIESRLGVPAATLLSASLAVALRHGTRIGIVTAGAAWEALLPPMAGALLGGAPAARVVSVRTFAATPDRIERDEPWALEQVEGLVRCCVRRDGADVVVVGGAGLSGLGLALTSVATPVVDSLAAAVLAARADVIALSRGCP